ncbi:MAG: gliding motility-associated C-terminal domain-containing protein, partial [Saprospiraceae bacterium]|nr:gliding motility-associated C-terminal domain-containing protein [Saprospiraceae bacterium]
DSKIYISTATTILNFKPNIHVIHRPWLAGQACQFQLDALSLAPGGANSGFCNFPAQWFGLPSVAFAPNSPDTICQLGQPVFYQLEALPCGVNNVVWKLEGLSGSLISNFQFASLTPQSAGTGRLIVQVFTSCGMVSDTLPIVVEDLQTPVLDLGPDQVVCANGVHRFTAGPGFERYRWHDGSADSVYTTAYPGMYWVEVWDRCGNRQADTIRVTVAPATLLDLGPDREQCPGAANLFARPSAFSRWQWLPPGAGLPCDTCAELTLSPYTSGIYTVIAQTADGCIALDTLVFLVRDTVFRSLDTFTCANLSLSVFGLELPADTTAQLLFPAGGPGQCDTLWTIHVFGEPAATSLLDTAICLENRFEYQGMLLDPGSETPFRFTAANGCDSVVTVRVAALPALDLSMPADTTIGIGASVLLQASASGAGPLQYSWTPAAPLSCTDCPDPTAAPEVNTLFTLLVTDASGCQRADSVHVRIDERCRWLPVNAFTPDGDGYNDWFHPVTDPCIRTVRHWQIFNRWGQEVFERRDFAPNQPQLGWDGGRHPSDVYIWVAEVVYYNGENGQYKGEVTLLR